ncbi:hypothetical protein ADK77_32260 [Streptomyces antibioticus]|nr:hypothetical protein ADK77_32260 [Streptomyces antibioticus]
MTASTFETGLNSGGQDADARRGDLRFQSVTPGAGPPAGEVGEVVGCVHRPHGQRGVRGAGLFTECAPGPELSAAITNSAPVSALSPFTA